MSRQCICGKLKSKRPFGHSAKLDVKYFETIRFSIELFLFQIAVYFVIAHLFVVFEMIAVICENLVLYRDLDLSPDKIF